MKGKILTFLSILLVIVLFTACPPKPAPPPPPAPPPEVPKVFTLKMQSTFAPPSRDYDAFVKFADRVYRMSGGRLKIETLPAGAVVPVMEVLDSVHKGILDGGHAWPGYWLGKHPAATLFACAPGGPFGMDWLDFFAWMFIGGGYDLYLELYQKELALKVIGFPIFPELSEPLGWFKKPVKSLEDLKGLKFRAAGMAAEVFKEMGMTVVMVPGPEIVPAGEKGIIDAAEYGDLGHEEAAGFHLIWKYYHIPGIHQPSGFNEILINLDVWGKLPKDLQEIIKEAALANTFYYWLYHLKESVDIMGVLHQKYGVTIVETPHEFLIEILKAWDRVAATYAAKSPFFKKVLDSQKAFASTVVPFKRFALPPYDLAADYYWKPK